MKKFVDLRLTFLMLAVVGIIAFVISYFTSLSFWIIFGITVVAILINGLVAIREDEVSGGFNNPRTKNDD